MLRVTAPRRRPEVPRGIWHQDVIAADPLKSCKFWGGAAADRNLLFQQNPADWCLNRIEIMGILEARAKPGTPRNDPPIILWAICAVQQSIILASHATAIWEKPFPGKRCTWSTCQVDVWTQSFHHCPESASLSPVYGAHIPGCPAAHRTRSNVQVPALACPL